MPLIQPATLLQVAEALQTNEVVLPCFVRNGEALRGHPVGFGAVCQQDLLNLSGNKGAAGVIIAYKAMKLIVNDIGVVTDINTLDDLTLAESLFGHRRQRLSGYV